MKKNKILHLQLTALYAGVHAATIGSIVAAIIVYYSFIQYSLSPRIVLWALGFLIVAYAMRSIDCVLYSQRDSQEENSQKHFKRYAFVTYLSALAWGLFFLALLPAEGSKQVYIMFCALGVVTAAISTLSYSRVIIIGYLLLIFVPLFTRLYLGGAESALALLLLNSILLIFLVVSINKFYFNFIHNLELVLTTQEQDESLREHHRKLEELVYERTQKLNDNVKRLNLAFSTAKQDWFDLNLETGELVSGEDHDRIAMLSEVKKMLHSPSEWLERVHSEDRNEAEQIFKKGLETSDALEIEYRWKTSNGHWLWLNSITQVVERSNGSLPVRIIGIHTDISERKKIEYQDDARSFVLEQVIEGVPLKTILHTIVQMIEQEDASISCSILLSNADNNSLSVGAAPSIPNYYMEAIDGVEIADNVGSFGGAAFTKKRVFIEDIQKYQGSGKYKSLAMQAELTSCCSEPILGLNQKLLGVLSVYRNEIFIPGSDDIKLIEFVSQLSSLAIERSQVNEELKLFASIFKEAREGIIVTDMAGSIVDVNPAFQRITGYSEGEVIGNSADILHSGKHSSEFYDDISKRLDEQGHWQGELWSRTKNGELYAQSQTISSIADESGKALHYVSIFSDITQSKNQQKELEKMAHYDTLTQLPNRTLFADRFAQSIVHIDKDESMLAVCFLDLDGFKVVNDTYGHNVGDQLLVEVTKRIKENIREGDTLSRQGGDEFTLLLDDIESFKQCKYILTRIHQSLALPYAIDGFDIQISASSGMTIYPFDNADLDTLLRHADQAMYNAKLAGRNRFHVFNAQEDKQAIKLNEQLQEMEDALSNEEFCLYYQPKVNMRTGKVFGVEALIRWRHPQKGMLSPISFLPMSEGTKLEIEIGNWVVNQAVMQLDLWREQGIDTVVSINVSSNYLLSPLFITELENALGRYSDIDASNLQLEILESSALGDLEAIGDIIRTCQNTMGISIALDDFGTGYSSLTHLKNLAADTIKIDQTFVRDMLNEASDCAIIESIIGLAKAFDRVVIAEGVETIAHGSKLLSMGCEQAQGRIISAPMEAGKFASWLTEYVPNKEWKKSSISIAKNKIRKLKIVT